MYKKYSYLEKTLTLELRFWERIECIKIIEPTLYNLFKFDELIKQEQFFQAIQFLNVKINELDFNSNPIWIIKWIYELIYGNSEKEWWEAVFLPSSIDIIAKRYWKTPIEVLRTTTPSQINTYISGIEYNWNIEAWNERENYIFKEKIKITEEESKKYDDIMERVNKAKEKLGK